MKRGDIVTHMFAPPPNSIIDDAGHILPEVMAARRRGVRFDLGNGRTGHLRWDIAEQVLKQLWQDETGVLSTQVLQEFYAALTSGIASPVPRRAARDLIHAYGVWPVVTLDAADVLAASDFEERYRLNFRDALVVVAARKSGATLLLSDSLKPYLAHASLALPRILYDDVGSF